MCLDKGAFFLYSRRRIAEYIWQHIAARSILIGDAVRHLDAAQVAIFG